MNAAEAEAYLLELELFGMRFGLDRMHRLMTVLGMPQRRFASVHVVGSNGKSSAVRMIAAILRRHGLRTGSYTSPHLRSFCERIEVDGDPIAPDDFGEAVTRAAHAAKLVDRTAAAPDDRVTQFEALTAAAYHELARRGVDVAVVEAGLGGRFDATNVIPSKVQVLTSVSLEHARWLGPTPAAIAEEKLAVVPDHGRLVIGPLEPEVEEVAVRVAAERHALLVRAPAPGAVELGVRGEFQRRNFAVARAAAEAFVDDLDDAAVERAGRELRIPGRLEVVDKTPLVLQDGAHNPEGARALAAELPALTRGAPLFLVVAVLEDKDADGILAPLLPLCEHVVYTRSANPRSLPPAALLAAGERLGGPPGEVAADARAALERARAVAGPDGAVLATGSIHLIAELTRAPDTQRASWL